MDRLRSLNSLLKWCILLVGLVNIVLLTLLVAKESMSEHGVGIIGWDQIIFISITYLLILLSMVGAVYRNYMVLISSGIILTLSLIYSFMGLPKPIEYKTAMVILTILVYILAIRIKENDLPNQND